MTRILLAALTMLVAASMGAPAWANDREVPVPASAQASPFQVHALIGTLAQPAISAESALSLGHADMWVDGLLYGESSLRIKLDLLGLPSAFSEESHWLKDAYIRTNWSGWDIQVGRFKVPLVTEGLEPAASLATIRRPVFNDASLGFGNFREPGLLFSGHLGDPFLVETGLFANDESDHAVGEAVVRLSIAPMEHLKLSVSHLEGIAGVAFGSRQRTGLDVEVEAGPMSLGAEAIMGTDAQGEKFGWLGLAKWDITPAWEIVAEVASWRTGVEDEREFTWGLNWAPGPRLRLMGNYIHEDYPRATQDLALVAWHMLL